MRSRKLDRIAAFTALSLSAATGGVAAPVTELFPEEDIPFTEFPVAYEEAHRGAYTFEIPEVYELVSIALLLSDWGWTDVEGNLFKDTDYAHEVMDHFGPHRDHALIVALNAIDFSDFLNLIGLRNNAYQWQFEDTGDRIRKIDFLEPWSRNAPPFMDDLQPLIEEFSRATEFGAFYAAHVDFYESQIQQMNELVAPDSMQRWLEREFPVSYDSYRMFFSPLTRGQHSMSENFGRHFSEVYTITAGPYFVRTSPELDAGPLLTKMVFTEIDHAYVNISTALHNDLVEDALAGSALEHWRNDRARSYSNAVEIMNELTTWAVFLLYVREMWPESYEAIRQVETDRMERARGFPGFGEFSEKLTSLYDSREPGQTIHDLYPALCSWMKGVASGGQ